MRRDIGVLAGKTRGRKERLRGHIGVRRRDGTSGCTILPPLERLYAVEPVGVLTRKPSAMAVVRTRW
jgi:hypothetical protein